MLPLKAEKPPVSIALFSPIAKSDWDVFQIAVAWKQRSRRRNLCCPSYMTSPTFITVIWTSDRNINYGMWDFWWVVFFLLLLSNIKNNCHTFFVYTEPLIKAALRF